MGRTGEGRDNIEYFFILRNLFEHPLAILQSSRYVLHLLPMIYDCSPRGIHSATTDSEEWKISHSSPHFSYKNISNASRNEKYFKHGLFDIQCFFLRYLMSDRVWWFLLSPSNQFCHHKSFSMFFLRQLSLGKRINSKSKMEEKERERYI